MTENITLNITEHIRSVPGFNRGWDISLREFLAPSAFNLSRRLSAIKEGKLDKKDANRIVTAFIGQPTAGKTTARSDVVTMLNEDSRVFDPDFEASQILWETGLDLGRKEIFKETGVTLDSKAPPTDALRDKANRLIEDRTYQSIVENLYSVLEIPATTAARIRGQIVGKNRCFNLFEDLANHTGRFKDLRYDFYIAGIGPDYPQRLVAAAGRFIVKNATSFEEAQTMMASLGKEPFESEAQFIKNREDGASLEAILSYQTQVQDLAKLLPMKPHFTTLQDIITQLLLIKFQRSSARALYTKDRTAAMVGEAQVIESIFKSMRVTPNRRLLGYNKLIFAKPETRKKWPYIRDYALELISPYLDKNPT